MLMAGLSQDNPKETSLVVSHALAGAEASDVIRWEAMPWLDHEVTRRHRDWN
jgi:hypothetical protein